MRFMVVIQTQFPIPPELMPSLADGFEDWWRRYGDRWESAGFFAGDTGGGGICNVDGVEAFHTMMSEWPLTPFSHFEVHPMVSMDVGLEQFKASIARMQPAR